jgi:pimeloyl-ACP methyl ester carboxylesterase
MPGVPVSQIQYNSPYNKKILQMSDTSFRKTATMMAKGMTLNKSKIDTLVKWMMEADRKTYVFGYVDLLKLDLRETLKLVKAKTLIIGAPNTNAEVTKANFEKQYANLDFKTIEMANNSNHFIMFDQPDWFYDQINSFLR